MPNITITVTHMIDVMSTVVFIISIELVGIEKKMSMHPVVIERGRIYPRHVTKKIGESDVSWR